MDVRLLDAVMEVVNKGIIIRENGEARMESDNLKDQDSGSVLMNCLWNTFDCCGDNFIPERSWERCSLKNMNIVTNIQGATGMKQPVDAMTMLEEHRNTMKANTNHADTTNQVNRN